MTYYNLEGMEKNFSELRDWSDGARRALDREREEMMDRVQLIDGMTRAIEVIDEILAENESMKTEIDDLNEQLEQKEQETDELRQQLLEARNQHLEAERQHLEAENHHLEAEVLAKPLEIHNHFESGSSSQVFNDKVSGRFTRKQNDKKKSKKRWKKIVRKML